MKAKMGDRTLNTKNLAVLSMLATFAIILSYVESFVTIVGIPGVKLGLSNLAIVIVLYFYGIKESMVVSVVKILVVGFLFGNMMTIVYSIAGGITSIIFMYLLKICNRFSVIAVSATGGVAHNIGQIIVAAILIDTYSVVYYAPVLIISGVVTGVAIGMVAGIVIARCYNIIRKI